MAITIVFFISAICCGVCYNSPAGLAAGVTAAVVGTGLSASSSASLCILRSGQGRLILSYAGKIEQIMICFTVRSRQPF